MGAVPRRSPALLVVHVVWATQRRRPVLPVAFDSTLVAIFGRKAQEVRCVLLGAGVAGDHVHLLLQLTPTSALAKVVQRMKGATAFDINLHGLLHPRLVWQAGYWAESLAPADIPPLRDYLRHQRRHHDDSHPAESWQLANDSWESAEGGL